MEEPLTRGRTWVPGPCMLSGWLCGQGKLLSSPGSETSSLKQGCGRALSVQVRAWSLFDVQSCLLNLSPLHPSPVRLANGLVSCLFMSRLVRCSRRRLFSQPPVSPHSRHTADRLPNADPMHGLKSITLHSIRLLSKDYHCLPPPLCP